MAMTVSERFWHAVALLARVDIAASIFIAVALFVWMTWH
jgi:hypothetical protein